MQVNRKWVSSQLSKMVEKQASHIEELETQAIATRKALFDALRKIRKLEKQLKEQQS